MCESLPHLLRRTIALREHGGEVLACLLVKARGSTPQAAGALMLVDDAAGTWGTIGGGCVEAEVRRRAHAMLAAGETGVMRFQLDHDYGWDDGLICGGTIEVAVGRLPGNQELSRIAQSVEGRIQASLAIDSTGPAGVERWVLDLPPRPRLLIAGAGHIGAALAALMVTLDFDVTVYDDRADLLARIETPGVRTVAGEIARSLRDQSIDPSCFCVIVTRGHRHDEQALHAVIGRGAAYVGMIGSRRKVKLIFDDLVDRGVSREHLHAVRAPIGLDIGSILVGEIALSIAAELVQTRRRATVRPVRGPFPAEPSCDQAEVSATTRVCAT